VVGEAPLSTGQPSGYDFRNRSSEGTTGREDGARQPTAFYDLYRLEDGAIAEHWDVTEVIAPRDAWKNDNGKF